jgi:hypothetical protein
MNLFAPLWAADLGDVIKVVIVVTIIFLSILSQVIGKLREAPKPQPDPMRPPRPPGPAAAGGQPRAQGAFDDEIAEFLRRAAQQQGGAGRGVPPPPRQAGAARQPGRPPAARPRPAVQPAARAVLAEVAAHQQEGLDRRGSGRGPSPAARGGRPEAAVAQAAPDVPGELPATAAAGFAVLLSDAESVAQAVVLSEILNRPTHRWE